MSETLTETLNKLCDGGGVHVGITEYCGCALTTVLTTVSRIRHSVMTDVLYANLM